MKIGVIKEIKDKEFRVGLTPAGARALVEAGDTIVVETGAGVGSGFADEEYRSAGARLTTAEQAWDSDLVVKVKEPLESEYSHLKGQMLFTYLHLAGLTPSLTSVLLRSRTTAIAYETVEDAKGALPLLAPMSAVAGNMAITLGSYYLARFNTGKGVLLGTVRGKHYGKVVIIGDGVVGRHAARTAHGMGASAYIVGRHPERAPELVQAIGPNLHFLLSTRENIARDLEDADLVVGAVLRRGAKTPYVVTEEMVEGMQPGSVIVDVSIDQGGCVASSRPNSHSDPVFIKHGVIHYCVTNMPGAYPRTSTIALTDATLPYVQKLAAQGIEALRKDEGFAKGVNTYQGYVTYEPVAVALDLLSQSRPFTAID